MTNERHSQQDLRYIMAEKSVVVDPCDRRSDEQILRALGHLPHLVDEVDTHTATNQERLPNTIPGVDYNRGIPSLRPESSRRNNMF